MAVNKTPGIKKVVSEFRRGKRGALSQYKMRSNNGTAFRFRLVIKKRLKKKKSKRRGEYLTYVTNLERWRIKRTMKVPYAMHLNLAKSKQIKELLLGMISS